MCFLSLRERHVSSQFDDFSQRIHLAFTNVHLLIASRSPCSLCALILPRQTPFHFNWLCVPLRFLTILASSHSALIALYTWLRSSLRSAPAFAVSTCFLAIDSDRTASSRTKCFLSLDPLRSFLVFAISTPGSDRPYLLLRATTRRRGHILSSTSSSSCSLTKWPTS